jgi:hypothetical protein
MSNRIQRLREYADPTRGPHGSSQDEAHIKYWQNRASENSDGADHRGNPGPEISLPNTGKRQESRPTEMGPKKPRTVDRNMVDAAKADLNFVGSSYMAGIRRDA